MNEFLKKYNLKHYKYYLSIVDKRIGEHDDLHKFIKSLGTHDILVWLKSLALAKEEPIAFFEESCILLTLVIRLFCMELDIKEVQLSNKEIIKLLERFEKALKTELAFRKEVIKNHPKYSIIKD